MPRTKADVIVLGAGFVGVSAALHLQARGRGVVIVDRAGESGRETSFGNTGIVQTEAIFPYAFPRDLGEIIKGAINRDPRAHIRYSSLPGIAPWVWRYFLESSPSRKLASATAMRPLIARSRREHEAIAEAAGAGAPLRSGGWIKAYRTRQGREAVLAEAETSARYDIPIALLDRAALLALEPHLSEVAMGGVHFTDPITSSNPGALVKSYADLFEARGGRLLTGDARSLEQSGAIWSVTTSEGKVSAPQAVAALGPWTSDVFRPLGYRFPLGVKRGYHMHFGARGDATLSRPVLDMEGGFVLTPMARGIRMTTGAEFARRDDPPSDAHFKRLEPFARAFFPLAERRDAQLWLGRRPCLPDMLPVIGAAPRHSGLWFDFGHQHLGLTTGPITGRMLAEMMTGETPCVDPTPYRAERFNSSPAVMFAPRWRRDAIV
jgi:D-amino-acid dehydrogenase